MLEGNITLNTLCIKNSLAAVLLKGNEDEGKLSSLEREPSSNRVGGKGLL